MKSHPQLCRNHLARWIDDNQDGSGRVTVQVIDRSPEYLKGFETGIKAAQRVQGELA